MAAPFLIKAVTDLLADIPASGKALLDVSCKEGDVLQAVAPLGFTVRGTNYEPTGPSQNGTPIDYGVDLLKPLPYSDASFDVVLLVEVIEHLENHRIPIGELARILKPGGVLILTTPNIMRLNSRFHFFFSGYHKTKRRFIPFETPLDQAHRFHNYPIDLPILYYLCKQNGLAIERIGNSKIKGFSRLLFLLFGFPVQFYTWYTLQLREKDPQQKHENQQLCRWLLDSRTLMEDNLVLRLRKIDRSTGTLH
ncbi:MAG: class I SAM-dependent methyltransferase [Deltaproteobacteria bacterium]|nr:class I SAM-dependent methyltransferase [Deltaproteobacteria bacterium]